MAEVTSLTAERILELTSQWSEIPAEQQDLRALISLLQAYVQTNEASLEEFREVILPSLSAELAENDLKLTQLNEVDLVNLESSLQQANANLQDLQTVTLPAMQEELANNIENVETRPKVYIQPTEPENPDEDERDLVVGDVWYNTADDNRQKIWNGVEWTTFAIDIPDLSLTVQKFKTSTHMIY